MREMAERDELMKHIVLTFDHYAPPAEVQLATQHLVQSLRKKYGRFEYMRFPARTRRGWAHLHMLCDCPFIPKKTLQEEWRVASKGSFVVWIKAVRSVEKLARYVAQDVLKDICGRVTCSRNFPNFPKPEKPDPSHDDPEKFTYRYFDIPRALAASGGSESLWTGESVYPNGPCECWKTPNPNPEGIPYRLREPHPETDERAPPCGLSS